MTRRVPLPLSGLLALRLICAGADCRAQTVAAPLARPAMPVPAPAVTGVSLPTALAPSRAGVSILSPSLVLPQSLWPEAAATDAGRAFAAARLSPALAGIALRSQRLKLADPDDALRAFRKAQVSLIDGKPTIFWAQGRIYSRIPGEPDRLLFTFQFMNIRAAKTVYEPGRGYGYRMVSRELLIYQDPRTGRTLRAWSNPWTGEAVEVVHVANDPVNMPVIHARGPEGPFRFPGTFVEGGGSMDVTIPLLYPNPLAGEAYREYGGGSPMYQAIEMFSFHFNEEDLLGPSDDAFATVSWSRVGPWLPWMRMGDRPGSLVYAGSGQKVSSFDALPPSLREEIDRAYPAWRSPPPLDDSRPNETTWTYFKRMLDSRKSKP